MEKSNETQFHENRIKRLVEEVRVPAQVAEIIPDDVCYARAVCILNIVKRAKESFKGLSQLRQLLESAIESDRIKGFNVLLELDQEDADAFENDVPAKLSNRVFADYVLGKYDEKPGCRSDIYKGYSAMMQAREKKQRKKRN